MVGLVGLEWGVSSGMKVVVALGGQVASNNVHVPMTLDKELVLHLAGPVGLLLQYV